MRRFLTRRSSQFLYGMSINIACLGVTPGGGMLTAFCVRSRAMLGTGTAHSRSRHSEPHHRPRYSGVNASPVDASNSICRPRSVPVCTYDDAIGFRRLRLVGGRLLDQGAPDQQSTLTGTGRENADGCLRLGSFASGGDPADGGPDAAASREAATACLSSGRAIPMPIAPRRDA